MTLWGEIHEQPEVIARSLELNRDVVAAVANKV